MRTMFSRSGLEVNQQGAACLSKMHIRATLAASLKEERMSAPSILFLHGGPGMSPVFEKARFPEASDVHWWQQPVTVPCAVHPFQDLLAATLAEFRRCVEAHGAPMTILASSFGAHLAVHLSRQMPESIARIVLLGPTFDPEQAAMRLARRAFQLHMDDANAGKLAAALAAYEDDPGRARFWDVFGALSLLPDVPELYFSPNAGEAARSFVDQDRPRPGRRRRARLCPHRRDQGAGSAGHLCPDIVVGTSAGSVVGACTPGQQRLRAAEDGAGHGRSDDLRLGLPLFGKSPAC
jgi:pimeloyl-ACP methyl ester carboxylesterase